MPAGWTAGHRTISIMKELTSLMLPAVKVLSTSRCTLSTKGLQLMLLLLLFYLPLSAQKFISRDATITFFSEAPLENIEAVNTKANSIFDLSTGEIVFSVPIREFQFEKSLMQKHFNENYMDSEIYPNSTFKGTVTGYRQDDGLYQAQATGDLFIHGITRQVQIDGRVEIRGDVLTLTTKFIVSLEDYDIDIPRILFSNIAESVEVSVNFEYKPYVTN